MTEDVYQRLREHLDSLPTGYPQTATGVELRILRKLFDEEEAEMACRLKPIPETAEEIALRLARDPEVVSELLHRMSRKGLILRIREKKQVRYMAIMFVVGILEFQLNRLDRELCEMLDEYMSEGFHREMTRTPTPQLRVVPVQESLAPQMEIQPYDELRKILESQKTIVLAECICRKKAPSWASLRQTSGELFRLRAMGNTMWKTGWAGKYPWKKRWKSYERMKKPAWCPARLMPSGWGACAAAAAAAAECSRRLKCTPIPAAW